MDWIAQKLKVLQVCLCPFLSSLTPPSICSIKLQAAGKRGYRSPRCYVSQHSENTHTLSRWSYWVQGLFIGSSGTQTNFTRLHDRLHVNKWRDFRRGGLFLTQWSWDEVWLCCYHRLMFLCQPSEHSSFKLIILHWCTVHHRNNFISSHM